METKLLISGKLIDNEQKVCQPSEINLFSCTEHGTFSFKIGKKEQNEPQTCGQCKCQHKSKMVVDLIGIGWNYLVFSSGPLLILDSSCENWREVPMNNFVKKISCNWLSTYIISDEGQINKFQNGNSDKMISLKSKDDEKIRFSHVCGGEIHTMAITDDNIVGEIIEEKSYIIFKPVDLHFKIKYVSCGKEHVLLLTRIGTVFSMGSSSRGQLGHGTTDRQSTPRVVEALEGISMLTIAAGGWHSAAVSDFGDLYMWGWNESGQLGMPSQSITETSQKTESEGVSHVNMLAVPGVVDLEEGSEDIRVERVVCGSRHTTALTVEGSVYSWGWNEYGQLGLGHTKSTDKPSKLEHFTEKYRVKDIVSNYWTTAYFVEEVS